MESSGSNSDSGSSQKIGLAEALWMEKAKSVSGEVSVPAIMYTCSFRERKRVTQSTCP